MLFMKAVILFGHGARDARWREPFDPVMATSPLNNPGDYTEANEVWLETMVRMNVPTDNPDFGEGVAALATALWFGADDE